MLIAGVGVSVGLGGRMLLLMFPCTGIAAAGVEEQYVYWDAGYSRCPKPSLCCRS
jgi:hypothetical protein